ncbi:hypothetical protein MVES1_001274 [Malassezia vespertilionis]|nr:uncharacterized protein MVES1_001274 [Malassezia vespertilionis]WFD05938.1 hypothetical protein MVES1_001274 [Malassezia vespertilionis]
MSEDAAVLTAENDMCQLSSSFGLESFHHGPVHQQILGRLGGVSTKHNLLMHNQNMSNSLSENFILDSFPFVSNPEYDLNGFLTQAVPFTQMVTEQEENNINTDAKSLTSMSCMLPMERAGAPQGLPRIDPNAPLTHDTYCSLYFPTKDTGNFDPMVSVVMPVISDEAALSTGMKSVSLALKRSPSAVIMPTIAKQSATEATEQGVLLHKHISARLYECSICHKMFERAYNRKMHLATHEAIENRLKPFVCPVESCGKRFARKHDKNRHYTGVHLRTRRPAGEYTFKPNEMSSMSLKSEL